MRTQLTRCILKNALSSSIESFSARLPEVNGAGRAGMLRPGWPLF